MSRTLLNIESLSMYFGGLRAVDHVDLYIDEGEIVALIGPNGAGKTTLFNCVTGVYKPSDGKMTVSSRDGAHSTLINKMKPNKITGLGLARTFQNIRLFGQMTALENVMIGRHLKLKSSIFGVLFHSKHTRQEEDQLIDDSMRILKDLGLDRYANEIASSLSYGVQRRLEIARAMASEPQMLLLDEPAAGMNPQETRRLDSMINSIRDEKGITILLIEHDMSLVMSLSERIYVLDYGKLIAEGKPEEVRKNRAVIKAYLGE